jgi:hypothetical protein
VRASDIGHMDYVKMGFNRCPQVAWQLQTTILFLAAKQKLILEKKKLEKALAGMSSMSENHRRYLFHKEMKSCDSTTWFTIWQFQTPAYRRNLQMHFQLSERFVISKWWSGFSERGTRDLPNGTNCISELAIFFCLNIHSLGSYADGWVSGKYDSFKFKKSRE